MPDYSAEFDRLYGMVMAEPRQVEDTLTRMQVRLSTEAEKRFGQQVDALTDAQLDQLRPPDIEQFRWDEMRQKPSFRDAARKKLFRDTPAEAFEGVQRKIRNQLLDEEFAAAKKDRLKELRPKLYAIVKNANPNLVGDDLERAILDVANPVLYNEGFGVVPLDRARPKTYENMRQEAFVGFVRGSNQIASSTRSFAADALGEAAAWLGDDAAAQQFFASGAGARRRGAAVAGEFPQSEDIKTLDMRNPRWWASSLGENAPQFALMMATGHAVGVAGKVAGLGKRAIEYSQAVLASGSIGVLEASSAYESAYDTAVKRGIAPDKARGAALEQAVVVGAVNALLESIPVGEFVSKIPGGKGRLMRATRGVLIEGGTEFLQEITAVMGEAYAKARTSGAPVSAALMQMGRPVPEQIDRILAAAVIGAALGGPAGATTTAQGRSIDPAETGGPVAPQEAKADGHITEPTRPSAILPSEPVGVAPERYAQMGAAWAFERNPALEMPRIDLAPVADTIETGAAPTEMLGETAGQTVPVQEQTLPAVPVQVLNVPERGAIPTFEDWIATNPDIDPALLAENPSLLYEYQQEYKQQFPNAQGDTERPAAPAGESIAAAAMQTPDGRVFVGATHGDAYNAAQTQGATDLHRAVEGFTTNTGRFVTRQEATEISRPAGQIRPGREQTTRGVGSEDLKPLGPRFATTLQTTTELSDLAKQGLKNVGDIATDAPGSAVTAAHPTYEAGSKNLDRPNKNIWVRQTTAPDNKGRTLLVQWSSDLLQGRERGGITDQYYDKLYQQRDGYVRADDFWELPQWIGAAANSIPNADVYIIRDVDEAIAFFNEAGYDQVAFSVLDVTKPFVQQIAAGYAGPIVVGGYADLASLTALPHVTTFEHLDAWVKSLGLEYKQGTDYRHFQGTPTQPRLTMSDGCLHGCTFCSVKPRKAINMSTPEAIASQVASFAGLDYTLVYLNDKTFGQAANHTDLIEVYNVLKAQNPAFQGFIIQTSAAQMTKLTPEFLRQAHIQYVEIGVESYNDEILKGVKKPATRKLILAAADTIRTAGSAMVANVMIGLPGETSNTYQDTIDFLAQNRDIVSHLLVNNLALYTGTELTDKLQSAADLDVNQNVVARSFHKDPAVHEKAYNDFSELGLSLLGSPSAVERQRMQMAQIASDQAVVSDPQVEVAQPLELAEGPPPAGILSELLSDERGGIDYGTVGQFARTTAGEALTQGQKTKVGLTAALISRSRALMQLSRLGPVAHQVYQRASSIARTAVSRAMTPWTAAWRAMPFLARARTLAWARTVRGDGVTNWATLVEHPDRLVGETIPTGIKAAIAAYRDFQDKSGDLAEELRTPQIQRVQDEDGNMSFSLLPFKKAKDGRYFHLFTPQGIDLFRYQQGPAWEALLDWFETHPDRNPDLPTDRDELAEALLKASELLADAQKLGGVRRSGSLLYVRMFKELPNRLMTKDGKTLDLILSDPITHFEKSVERQYRDLALWRVATEDLVPRYGKYNEDLDQTIFPLGARDLGMTDVPGLLDKMRTQVAQASTDPGRAENLFNQMQDDYGRIAGRTLADDLFTPGGERTFLGRVATGIKSLYLGLRVSLSPLWDLTHGIVAWSATGTEGLKGAVSALGNMIVHPRAYGTELEAVTGAMTDSVIDWSVHRDTFLHDVLGKPARNLFSIVMQSTERRKQFMFASMWDRWLQAINTRRDVTPNEAARMRNTLYLSENQIAEISRGEMSPETRASGVQAGVNAVAGLSEFSINRAAIQNDPLAKFLFPFNSVTTATARLVLGFTDTVQNAVGRVNTAKTTKERRAAVADVAKAAAALLGLVAGIAGHGFLSEMLRRVVKGRPMRDPDDPDSWTGMMMFSMLNGGIMGPFGRIIDADKYSGRSSERFVTNLVVPLGFLVDTADLLLGRGNYADTPWGRRLQDYGARQVPAYNAALAQIAAVLHPQRNDYYLTRKLVRAWDRAQGKDSAYTGGAEKNPYYYQIFEAMRDDNPERLQEALTEYKTWAQEQGLDSEAARLRLASSLNSRRPVNLNPERRVTFFGTLTPRQRAIVEAVDQNYVQMLNGVTRRPGMPPPKPPRPAVSAKPRKGGDWYVD